MQPASNNRFQPALFATGKTKHIGDRQRGQETHPRKEFLSLDNLTELFDPETAYFCPFWSLNPIIRKTTVFFTF